MIKKDIEMNLGKKTFFEHIGLSGIERVHSQVFQWILDEDFEGISDEGKIKFVNDFFDIGLTNHTKIIEVLTEHKSVDIIIETEEAIIAIENKIKSSQHSDQLNRYTELLREEYKKPLICFFLTLVDENSGIDNWKNITYSQLRESLESLSINNTPDGIILKEYLKTIYRLSFSLDEFLKEYLKPINSLSPSLDEPTKYKTVFKNGGLKKKKKDFTNEVNYPTEIDEIIGQNQLETIFQKAYLNKVTTALDESKEEIIKLKQDEVFYVKEERGLALLGVVIKTIKPKKGSHLKSLILGMDVQGQTSKIFITGHPYNESKASDIPEAIVKAFQNKKTKSGFIRFNKPRTKAQYSITKKSEYQPENMPSVITYAKYFAKELKTARSIIDDILNESNTTD
jgi:hypothetical protein